NVNLLKARFPAECFHLHLFASFGEVAVAVGVNEKRVAVQDKPEAAIGLQAEHQETVFWGLCPVNRLLGDGAVDVAGFSGPYRSRRDDQPQKHCRNEMSKAHHRYPWAYKR